MRWIAAAVLALALAYPASTGPLFYMVGRGWMPRSAYLAIYRPLSPGRKPNVLGRMYLDYTSWWYDLAWDHSGRPDVIVDETPLWNVGTNQNPKWTSQRP